MVGHESIRVLQSIRSPIRLLATVAFCNAALIAIGHFGFVQPVANTSAPLKRLGVAIAL
ncbi:MAG: hypothetical protein AAGH83_07095 [Pseudomonadota bacterium]